MIAALPDAETWVRSIPEYAAIFAAPPLLSAREVARLIGIGPAAIARACQRGEILGAVGHRAPIGWRIPRSALCAWLVRRAIACTPEEV